MTVACTGIYTDSAPPPTSLVLLSPTLGSQLDNLPVHRRARLQELMLERGESPGGQYGPAAEERERLASANAQRNIVSKLSYRLWLNPQER